MAWILMRMERAATTQRLNENILKKTQIKRLLTKLGNFASAIGDGQINPTEIGSVGNELFGDALDFMGYGRDVAQGEAQDKTMLYEQAYSDVTAEQYYNNPALASQASLYFDESGSLNTDKMYEEFYEESLKEWAEEYIKPMLNEKETELQNELDSITAECEMDQAYLEQLESATSAQTPKIKLS